ncbi:MAG: hypothetical protein ACXWK1_21085, partial [Caulobacteraceae bacterium]
MKRNPLYSGSAWSRPPRGTGAAQGSPVADAPAQAPPRPSRFKAFLTWRPLAWIGRHRWAASTAAMGAALGAFVLVQVLHPPRTLTQADIDAAVDY